MKSTDLPNTARAEEAHLPQIQHELVNVLYRQAPTVFIGTLIVASSCVLVLWDKVAQHFLLLWAGLVFALTLARTALVRQYWRSNPEHTPESHMAHAHRWGWRFAFSAGLSGCLWGAFGTLFLLPEDHLMLAFVVIVLVGMSSGSVAALSAFRPAYAAFALLALLPFALACFWQQEFTFTMFGVLALFLLAVNLSYSRTIHATLLDAVKLRFENISMMRQLAAKADYAMSANTAKTKFLAAASHDLRQPVHAMGLFISALEKLSTQAALNPAQLRNISGKLRESIQWLGKMLDTLLHISSLDTGAIIAQPQAFRVQSVFDAIQNQWHDAAKHKGVDLCVQKTSLSAWSDPFILQQQILVNFVSNAIRYRRADRAGRIVLGCRRRGGEIEIQVWDNGIGIAEAEWAPIFEEYHQVDNPARNPEMGLGLGLAIVKKSASLLAHPLRVESVIGKGTMFSVTLERVMQPHYAALNQPIQPNALPTIHHDNEKSTAAILVIDDNAQVLSAMQMLLEAWGYAVIAAASGAESDAKATQAKGNIGMIITDYRLENNTTGVDAIQRVTRAIGRAIPAVIITGDTSTEGIQRARASGFRVLHKPLDNVELQCVIEEMLG